MHSISSSSYGSLPQNLFDQHTFEQQPDAGSNPFANLGAPRPQSYSAFSGLPPLTTPAAKAPMGAHLLPFSSNAGLSLLTGM